MWFFNGLAGSSVIGYVTLLVGVLALSVPILGSDITFEVGHSGEFTSAGFFPNITDLISTRDEVEARTWMNAMSIFQRLKTTTCGTEAAGRLFGTCKTLGNDASDESDHTQELDQVKMLYAIRMGICETGAGGADIPRACKDGIKVSSSLDDEKTYVKDDLKASKHLKQCIGSLQKQHFLWTSYSNNLQDASALCDAPRQDVEGRRMMSMYREMLHGVFGIAELLKKQLINADEWILQAEVRASELDIMHGEILKDLTNKHKEHSSRVVHDFQAMHSRAKAASEAVGRVEENMERIISGVSQNITHFHSDLETMLRNAAGMYTGVSTEVTTQMNEQLNQLDHFGIAFASFIADLNSTVIAELNKDLLTAHTTWQSYSEEISQYQDQQIATSLQLNNISQETLMHQHEARAGAQYTSERMQLVADQIAEMEKPFQAMSLLLEAYKAGYLRSTMIEFAIACLVFSTTGIGLLIPRCQLMSTFYIIFYIWVQSLRIVLGYLDLVQRIKIVNILIRQHLRQQPIYLAALVGFALLFCLLGHLRSQFPAMVDHAEVDAAARAEHERRVAAFQAGLDERGGSREFLRRAARAATAPPWI